MSDVTKRRIQMKRFLTGATAALAVLAVSAGAASAQTDGYEFDSESGVTGETACVDTPGPPPLDYAIQFSGAKTTDLTFNLRFERNGNPFGSPVDDVSPSGSIDFPTNGDGSETGYINDGWTLQQGLLVPGNAIIGTNGVRIIAEVVDNGDGGATYTSTAVAVGLDDDSCVGSQPPPSIDVDGFTTICVQDAPFIAYDIELDGLDWPGNATLTFRTVNGDFIETRNVTQQTGQIVYPGAAVGPDGSGIDWPGWRQAEDGSWEPDPTDEIYRQGVVIEVEVNPTDTVTVTYPAATEACANPPQQEQLPPPPPAQELPGTGLSTFETTMRIAALALIGGLGFVIVARRRRFVTTTTA